MSLVEINHDFRLPIRNEDELRRFVNVVFAVTIPDQVVVPGHSTPWRAFRDAYFAASSLEVWIASRGFGGKSFLLALLGLTEALTLGANVKILGGSGAQSRNVQSYISTELYQKPLAPRDMWVGEPLNEISRFCWGNSIQSLMASSTSVRGPHPQRLRLDECDEMSLAIFDAALGQTLARVEQRRIMIAAQTVASSTHHYPDGTMTEILKRASAAGWPVHRWSYHETSVEGGWLLPEQVEEKRGEVTAQMFETEYELQTPNAEGRAIMAEWVEATFDPGLGEYEGRSGEYIEIEPPERGASYVTGADWAKQQDFTVIVTWRKDVQPYRLVAFERRNREPWPAMVARFDRRVARYPGAAAHDKTGVGDVVDDYKSSDSTGIVMVGNARKDLLTNYVAAIEDGAFVAPRIEYMYNEHLYADVNDLYGSGHLPDSVAAAALAYTGVTQRTGGGTVKTLAQRREELRTSVILRYTGNKSFSVELGDSIERIRPGWRKRVGRDLGEAIVARFPEHFISSDR
jgi:hypothetical protein